MKIFRKIDCLFIFLILAFALLYGTVIFNDSLWGDEAYTMLTLKNSFSEILKITARDVHPPLYYFIAKIFTLFFGYSVPVVKLASIVPLILTMFFVWTKSKKIFGKQANLISLFFILLTGLCPATFSMAVELRMYTWAMFFVTTCGIYAYELYRNPQSTRYFYLFILFGVLSAYTHYYAFLTVCFIYLFLIITLLKRNKKDWKLCVSFSVISFLAYLPWIPLIFLQFSVQITSWWATVFNMDTILGIITFLFAGNFSNLFLLLFATIFIGFLHHLRKKQADEESYLALLAILPLLFTVLLGILFSLLVRPVFVARYMYPASGLFFLGFSILICKRNQQNLFTYLTLGLLLINLPFSYASLFHQEYENGTENFKQFAKDTFHNAPITTTVKHLAWSVLPYYCPENEVTFEVSSEIRGYLISAADPNLLRTLLKDATLTELYRGNIDNNYVFAVYYVE